MDDSRTTLSSAPSGNTTEHDDENEIIVFQCLKCRLIIGDSCNWVHTDVGMDTVVLRKMTRNVLIEDSIHTATGGPDAGSTFKYLRCASCQSQLGKHYLGTLQGMDEHRGHFSISVKKIGSYQVGEGELTAKGVKDFESTSVHELFSHMRKMQSLVLDFNNRITDVEAASSYLIHKYRLGVKAGKTADKKATAAASDADETCGHAAPVETHALSSGEEDGVLDTTKPPTTFQQPIHEAELDLLYRRLQTPKGLKGLSKRKLDHLSTDVDNGVRKKKRLGKKRSADFD